MYQEGLQVTGTWWLTSYKVNDCEFVYFLHFHVYYVNIHEARHRLIFGDKISYNIFLAANMVLFAVSMLSLESLKSYSRVSLLLAF